MVSQREKFVLSAASIVSYSCGLAEAQSFCTCIFSLAEKAAKHVKNCKESVENFFFLIYFWFIGLFLFVLINWSIPTY